MIQIRRPFKKAVRGEEWIKWLHVFPKLSVIRNLVQKTKSVFDVSGTDGCWRVLYGAVELWKRANPLFGGVKPRKVYFSNCKLELVGVRHYANPTNSSKKINGTPPMFLQVIVVEDGVVYYTFLPVKVSKDSIKSMIATVSR